MTDTAHPSHESPIWARADAFPPAPEGCGWVDGKDNRHPVDSIEALLDAIREDRSADIVLAWSPADAHMILPEEVAGAAEAIRSARKRRAQDDLADALSKLRFYGILLGNWPA